MECAAARAATRYRSAATASCTTDLLRRGSAHCTCSADVAATLAVNEWFELKGAYSVAPPSSTTSPCAGLHRLDALQGRLASAASRRTPRQGYVPPVPARLVWPLPPSLPGPDHRDQGSYQAANASVRCRSAIVVGVLGRKLRRREVAAGLVRPPDAPLRVGRRYPAAAPDAPPSRPWDSGVRPAPPSPSSPPSQHSGRRRTWAGAGRAFGHAAPAAARG